MGLKTGQQRKFPNIRDWLAPRRLRTWREHLTGYLMIAPSTVLIFIFGIFPVGFALFVSLHRWRLKRGEIIGLKNYTDAIGNIAYLLVFALAIGILVWAFSRFRKAYRTLQEKPLRFWLLNIPGTLLAATTISFIRWAIVLLPNILDIANKIPGLEKTRELFIQLLGEAFRAPDVLHARSVFIILFVASVIAVGASVFFGEKQ
jgi:ABC-type sugar transport system permease subunit